MIIPVDNANIHQAAFIHLVAWQSSHRLFCSAEFIEAHTIERQTEYLLNKMAAGSKIFMLIEDAPIGLVSVNGSLIEDLYVFPEKQSMGYGSKLLLFAVSLCTDTPSLWILENNTGAARLYRRLGFKETGRRKQIPDGIDEIEFSLE